MILIGLTGLPRSGKDTLAACLREYGFTRLAFADPLKQAAAVLLGREMREMNGDGGFDREAVLPEWGFSTRDFLQRFGTEVMRDNFGPDFWLKHMRNKLANRSGRYVITDVRFENEAALIHEFGGIVAMVKRPGCVKSGHRSDAEVLPDRYVYNDQDLEHLKREATYLAAVTSRSAPESA